MSDQGFDIGRVIASQKVLLLGTTLSQVKKLARSEAKLHHLAAQSPQLS